MSGVCRFCDKPSKCPKLDCIICSYRIPQCIADTNAIKEFSPHCKTCDIALWCLLQDLKKDSK